MRLVVSAGLALLAGCDAGIFGPDHEMAITTDRAEYTAGRVGGGDGYQRYGFTLVARFENLASDTLYLGRCYPESTGPRYGVGVSADSVGAAYNHPWACVGHDQQFAVEPGGTRTDTLELGGTRSWDDTTGEPLGGALEGEFWLQYDVRLCPGACPDRVEGRLGRSNTFTVRLAPES